MLLTAQMPASALTSVLMIEAMPLLAVSGRVPVFLILAQTQTYKQSSFKSSVTVMKYAMLPSVATLARGNSFASEETVVS